METTSGSTRFVLVFSFFVIKFPKVRIIRPIFRAVTHLFKRQFRGKLRKFDEKNVIKAGVKYLCPGLKANRIEYLYSKRHKGSNGIVCARGLFWGLILIQKKVDIIDVDNEIWERFKKILKSRDITEVNMYTYRNFGFDNGKFKIIDCGCQATIEVLNAGGLTLIEQFEIAQV